MGKNEKKLRVKIRQVKENWLLEIKDSYYICPLCGKPIYNCSEISIDHKKPVSKNGTNEPENLQPTHGDCNNKRGSNYLKIITHINSYFKTIKYRYMDIYKTRYNISITTYFDSGNIIVKTCSLDKSGASNKTEVVYDRICNELKFESKAKYRNCSGRRSR